MTIPTGYDYTRKFFWMKTRAEKAAEKAKAQGYSVIVVVAREIHAKRQAYLLFAKTNTNGRSWTKNNREER